jgi:N6-adenosine-specific RNA methylase IME4
MAISLQFGFGVGLMISPLPFRNGHNLVQRAPLCQVPTITQCIFTDFNELRGAGYPVGYIDPPWSYSNKGCGGSGTSGAHLQYPLMTLQQLKQLPVGEVLGADACLFMWVTMPLLEQSFELFRAWGVPYKTCAFTWIKLNKRVPTLFWGMGFWTRSNAELCLMGVRGKPERASARVHSVIQSPIEGHSRKPAECRARIDTLCGPDLPKLEIFARGEPGGVWDAYGNTPAYATTAA